jgi:hypothetical protein
MFTLENVKVVTGSTGLADPMQWASAVYVRNGNITANDVAKTRRVNATDFIQSNRRYLKYSFFMQGGFNGVNVFDSDESQLNDTAVLADMNDITGDMRIANESLLQAVNRLNDLV